jgi:hypothetical protein
VRSAQSRSVLLTRLSLLAVVFLVGCRSDDKVTPAGGVVRLSVSDPSCLQQCDAYGDNCVYPTYPCHVPTCDRASNQLSVSSCLNGACAIYQPAPCHDLLTCADDQSCLSACTQASDCISGYKCQLGRCVLK